MFLNMPCVYEIAQSISGNGWKVWGWLWAN